jgi:hypothetical protein
MLSAAIGRGTEVSSNACVQAGQLNRCHEVQCTHSTMRSGTNNCIEEYYSALYLMCLLKAFLITNSFYSVEEYFSIK